VEDTASLTEAAHSKDKYSNFLGRISMFMDGKCGRGSLTLHTLCRMG